MSIKISGDFAKIAQWQKRFGAAAVQAVKRDVLTNIGAEAIELVAEGFKKESDPYGKHWAPLKARVGRILQDTGRLRSSFTFHVLGSTSVKIGPGVGYATFHQSGTSRMVARKMVPEGRLPSEWGRRFEQAAQDVMEQAFGG